jgi:hypothetical protein
MGCSAVAAFLEQQTKARHSPRNQSPPVRQSLLELEAFVDYAESGKSKQQLASELFPHRRHYQERQKH